MRQIILLGLLASFVVLAGCASQCNKPACNQMAAQPMPAAGHHHHHDYKGEQN